MLIKKYKSERNYKSANVHFVSGEYYKEVDIQEKISMKLRTVQNGNIMDSFYNNSFISKMSY